MKYLILASLFAGGAEFASAQTLPMGFDCLRTGGLGVVSADRGSRHPDAAENSIGAFGHPRQQ